MAILLIVTVVFVVIYVIVVLIGMVESRNDQIKGMLKTEDTLWENLQEITVESDKKEAENLKLAKEIDKLKAENKDLKNADARNTGLYYKIVDLSNENVRLKDEIKRLSK